MKADVFSAIGSILAKLHSLDSPLAKSVSREQRLIEMDKKIAKLAQAFPAFGGELVQLSRRMQIEFTQLPALKPVVIHGDIHIGQFMLTADNTVAILDFDGCSYGDPAQDLADMLVDPHLNLSARGLDIGHNPLLPVEFATSMLSTYREHAPQLVSNQAIVWQSRVQLINNAYRAAITQEVDWALKIPKILKNAASHTLLNAVFPGGR